MSLSYLLTNLAVITEDQINVPKTSLSGGEGGALQYGLQLFFGLAAAVAVLVIAIGAFRYVISRGDANSIKTAKETILYAAIGLIVTMSGYGIVTFVVNNI